MKYFGIIDTNVAAIFQSQWKIGNISHMFLQYSVLYGYLHSSDIWWLRVFEDADYECELNKNKKTRNVGFNMVDQNLNCIESNMAERNKKNK